MGYPEPRKTAFSLEVDQPVDQLADAGCFAIDPIDVAEGATGGVVIDVDEEEFLEAKQSGALGAIALQDDSGVIGAVHAEGGANGVRSRQGAMNNRNVVGRDEVSSLAHLLEQLSHREDAADGVPIGA